MFKDPTEKFIPGTYIRSSSHEFGKENDTLIVSLQNADANQYKIERRWRYQRVLDGNPIEPEYKITTTSGVFNDKEQVLREDKTGLMYSFDIKRNLLFTGSTEYRKVN
jgi:hypothetical protein